MHAPLKVCLLKVCLFNVCFALLVLSGSAVQAAPSTNSHSNQNPPSNRPVSADAPDYGGRESAMPAVGEAAPDPAAQAGRALEALVVVLAGVAGVVYVLKRFNLVKAGIDGKPARIAGPVFGRTGNGKDSGIKDSGIKSSGVTVVSSQTLPGGAMLHVVQIGEKTLLLAATAQSVTPVAEWATQSSEASPLSGEFEEYLTRADPTSGIAAANARLRSLLSPKLPEEPS